MKISHASSIRQLKNKLFTDEKEHFPIGKTTLADVIKSRMNEMNLTQKSLAEILEISAPRVSEYLTGKAEPTLQIARRIHQKLNIDANIILGCS